MKNSTSTNRLALYLAASTFIFTGCVSTGTHEKMQAEKNQEIAGLQQEKTALEQQKVELQKQLETLRQQKHALEAQTKQRQAQNEALVRKLHLSRAHDCFRVDKSMAAWGIGARVALLATGFLDVAMRIPARREQFSDGVPARLQPPWIWRGRSCRGQCACRPTRHAARQPVLASLSG